MIGCGKSTRDPVYGLPTNARRVNYYSHFRRSRRPARTRLIANAAALGDYQARSIVFGAWRLFRKLFKGGTKS